MSKLETIAKALRLPGRYYAGDSIRLNVRGGSALWEWQHRAVSPKTGKPIIQTVPLGSAKGPLAMNLTQAREAQRRKWLELRNGVAVVQGPRGTVVALQVAAGRTFGDVLEKYLADKAPAWKGGLDGEEAAAHRRLLGTKLAKLDIARIDQHDVKAALTPWAGRPIQEKLRVKINSVIDYATASGLRVGENPARKAIMGKLLPDIPKAKRHAAIAASDIPAFMVELAKVDTAPSRALQWLILTASRSGETRCAVWSEINGDWSIPGKRMKEDEDHTVPITPQMRALLGERGEDSDLVFGIMGERRMLHLLQRLRPGYTVHGLRRTFSDWAGDKGYSLELREIALAHAVGDATVKSYNEGNRLELRREMMAHWSEFATSASTEK
jgi:integrase